MADKRIPMKRMKQFFNENRIFGLFWIGMVIYYGCSMFLIKPWYDELYTYYSFISRGPVYAAIHWPVPNNHVFYSVLSAFLDYLGNPYIGLRGVSFLAACANLILLYLLACRLVNRQLAAGAVFLYAAIWQVNNLSVQGRGYTLSITCYLISLLSLYVICTKERAERKYYMVYACSLTGGLYALISSTFWVIPVCIAGGIVLLFAKKYKTLQKLIVASVTAACMTIFLYAVIWLAIGSNLLSKDPSGIYYGIYQVNIILKAPFEALRTGMDYMLATPYIQGDERSYIVAELFHYLSGVFNLFYSGLGEVLVVVCGVLGVAALVYAIRSLMPVKPKEPVISPAVRTGTDRDSAWFFGGYLFVTVVMVPVMLIIQSVQPYYRVFSFLGVPVSLLLVFGFCQLCRLGKARAVFLSKCLCGLLFAFCLVKLCGSSYHEQYGWRENEIVELFEGEAEQLQTIFYADDYGKYVLKFYYDREPAEAGVDEAQYILVPKELYNEDYEVPVWPTLYGYGVLDTDRIRQSCELVGESDLYELYCRKE